MKNVNLLIWVTQLGISVAVPPAAFILLAVWLRNKFDWGSWILIVGIILGVVCAAEGFFSSLKAMRKMSEDKKEKPPLAFNDHD